MKEIIFSIIGAFVVLYIVMKFFSRRYIWSRLLSLILAVASPVLVMKDSIFAFTNNYKGDYEYDIKMWIIFSAVQLLSALLWEAPTLFDEYEITGKYETPIDDDDAPWTPQVGGGFFWNTVVVIIVVAINTAISAANGFPFILSSLLIYGNVRDIIWWVRQ